jgi:glutathione S-transferase
MDIDKASLPRARMSRQHHAQRTTMKLYFSPGACSLAPHIVLHEAGQAFSTARVNLRKKLTADGADYTAINPKGYVPALEVADGAVLTECAAIMQYVADLAPAAQLAPAAPTAEHYQMLEWLSYIGTELHKGYGPLFNPAAGDDAKSAARALLARRFGYVAQRLEGRDFLVGERFSLADAYLFTVTNWAPVVQFDLSAWPALAAFHARIAARPAVQRAMRDEGLLA